MIRLLLVLALVAQARTCMAQSEMRQVTKVFEAQGHTAAYQPPTIYEDWWHEMELCANAKADLHTWQFVAVYADAFTVAEDSAKTLLFGATLPSLRRIYYVHGNIAQRARVQHEMLHAILHDAGKPWRHRDPDHPDVRHADDLFQKCSYR
jgi:hypothetical protein